MTIPFIDLATQQTRIRSDLNARIARLLDHGQYILGPEIEELEFALAKYVGTKHCISLSSGTDALLVAMMAYGIGPGDEVITTPFTFFATGEMIELLGARAVFVDIDPDTYNMNASKIESKLTKKTRAIVPVSLYGQCADFDLINAIGKKHGVPVIEDAAQSFGATYKGKRSCSLSEISCTSFFPSKPLGCYGDGGACFTNDDDMAQNMREVRNHGQERRYYHTRLGLNARMDTMQAAILLAKMPILDDEIKSRERIGEIYTDKIRSACGESVKTPVILKGNTSPYAQYTVAVNNRAAVIKRLNEQGIPTAVHYPVPLSLQPVFAKYGEGPGSYPISENAAERVLSLPMHPYLKNTDIDRIAQALANAVDRSIENRI